MPASVPSLSSGSTSPSSPASLPSPSLLIHLLIITVLTFSSGWSILMTVVQVSSSLSRSMTLEGHAKTFHCPVWPAWSVGLLQFILTLLEPVWMVSPVWCHPLPPSPGFIPAPHFSFEEHLCCSHISAALLLSLPALVLFVVTFQRMQTHLSCTSSPTGSTPGAEPRMLK